ncbi:Basic region leucine zipper [Gracilaria domingensis]|nr:Basic region leucine zipper [Gracilaria domingensis]
MPAVATTPAAQHVPPPTRARAAVGAQKRGAGVVGGGRGGGASSSAVAKRLARALRNRESARRSRLKSKMRVQSLEVALASLKEENCVLRNALCHILPACLQRCPRLRSQLRALLVELKLLA